MALRLPVPVERAFARAFLSLPPSLLRRIVGPPRCSPDGLELDLQLQTLLWLIDRMKVPPFAEGPVDQARLQMDRAAPTLDLAPAPRRRRVRPHRARRAGAATGARVRAEGRPRKRRAGPRLLPRRRLGRRIDRVARPPLPRPRPRAAAPSSSRSTTASPPSTRFPLPPEDADRGHAVDPRQRGDARHRRVPRSPSAATARAGTSRPSSRSPSATTRAAPSSSSSSTRRRT